MGLSPDFHSEWTHGILACVKDSSIFIVIFLLQEGLIKYLMVLDNLNIQVISYPIVCTSLQKCEGILLACHGLLVENRHFYIVSLKLSHAISWRE